MSKRVLVTGAGGFVGANLVYLLLERGDEVHIFSRPESSKWRLVNVADQLRFHDVLLTDKEAVLKAVRDIRPEQVFHLAHYGGNPNEHDTDQTRKVIIEGTSALYDACSKVGSVEVVVHAGSSSEYGSKKEPMREDMVLEPNTLYGCAKAWATLFGRYLAREKDLPIVTLRLFAVFGPWEHLPRFMPSVILAALRGRSPGISNPAIARDFIYVGDVVRAFLLTSEIKPAGEIINIGYGRQMTLGDAAGLILKHTKSQVPIQTGLEGRSFDRTDTMWQADISKAKKVLNWRPEFSQEERIAETIKWFHENQDLYSN